MKLAWTLVTLASFAALPAVAQDTDADADAEDIEEVVDDVLDADADGDGDGHRHAHREACAGARRSERLERRRCARPPHASERRARVLPQARRADGAGLCDGDLLARWDGEERHDGPAVRGHARR